MLGYSLEEIKNLGIMDIHPEGDLPYVIEQFEKQSKKEITLAKNIPVKRKDGSVFYSEVNSSPITLADKTYLMGIFRDITERKRAEEALEWSRRETKESQELYQSIINNMNDVVVTTDTEDKITSLNMIGQELLGFEYKAVLDKHISILFAEKEKLMNAIQMFKEGKFGYDYEINLQTIDGNAIISLLTIASLKALNKNDMGRVFLLHDIRNRKKAEDELKKSHEELQKRVNELEHFQKVTVDREIKMVELKKRIRELEDVMKKQGIKPGDEGT